MDKWIGALAMGAVVLGTACSYTERDWEKASAANTVTAYRTFIQGHPQSTHVDFAQGRILALQDDAAWSAARSGNTLTGYQAYLSRYGGRRTLGCGQVRDHLAAARRRLEVDSAGVRHRSGQGLSSQVSRGSGIRRGAARAGNHCLSGRARRVAKQNSGRAPRGGLGEGISECSPRGCGSCASRQTSDIHGGLGPNEPVGCRGSLRGHSSKGTTLRDNREYRRAGGGGAKWAGRARPGTPPTVARFQSVILLICLSARRG